MPTNHKVVEICAGAGGQSLGLHLAGFDHALAIEIDENAATTLRNNLRRISRGSEAQVAVGDVADPEVWQPEDYKGVDLVAGGVPCPPFSVAGKQLGASDERDLFAWAVELASKVNPRALMLENVRGLMGARFSGYRQAVVDRLEELGYIADWQLLEAKDYGVPQLRPRTVLVALRPEDAPFFEWPTKSPTDKTVGSTLVGLMAADGWRGAEAWAQRACGIAPTLVGGSKKHGGADLGPTRAKAAWRALGVDGLGIADAPPTAKTPVNFVPKLTNEMVARLQGWDDDEYAWQFSGRKTSVYRQIGNAFPPPVAREVGSSIRRALDHHGEARVIDLRRVEHDPVYVLLRDAKRPVSAGYIADRVGSLEVNEVIEHLERLAKDFEVVSVSGRSETKYKLGDFRAFRGQDDHVRHDLFAASRASIS